MSGNGYWYLDADSRWHRRDRKHPQRARCGQDWVQVTRVSTSPPAGGLVCEACVHAGPAPQRTPAKRSKALRATIAQLRARGVREELVEPLAQDALARRARHGRSVRTVSGGLPTLGKHT